MDQSTMQTWLPLLVIGAVFALRFRSLKRPVPFRPLRMLIAPVLVTVVFGLLVLSMPPSGTGWLLILVGIAIGAIVGWKRGDLMHLDRDATSGEVMVRQSPAALLFILAIIFARRTLSASLGIDTGADAAGHMSNAAVLLTDSMLGFALGMVVALRWTLWQRAKAVPHG
ncbi:MAG: CcdC protein domain-containing protein [Novosphingobium sp.]